VRALIALAFIILSLLAGCSKAPAKLDPCNLLPVSEAQSLDGAIAKSQWFPANPKKGEADELCVYMDANGDARVMLFAWPKRSDARDAVKSGMKSASDKVVDIAGVGESAAAGFSYADGDTLKLFAAESKGRMVGIRPRDPIKENDEKFARVKALAASALGRMK
jgi:hypothetical protein